MNATSKERIQCSGCKAGFKVKAAAIGKKVKCPKCETVFVATPVAAKQAVPVAHGQAKSATKQTVKTQTVRTDKPAAPAGTKRCDMCHEFIPIDEFSAHYEQHQGNAEDGQHNSYPTLPPEERWKGDLKSVPQNYIHPECGSVTGMPEEITRTYLVNPYFYGYSSFCCGCETHISGKELKWVDTGETLYDYTRRLQAENPNSKKYRNAAVKNLIIAAMMVGVIPALLAAVIGFFVGGLMTAATSFVTFGLIGSVLAFAAFFKMRGGI